MQQLAEQDVAVVRDVYDAFEHGDVPRIFARFAPDGVVEQSPALPWGGTHVGAEGLGRFLAALTGHLDSAAVTERLYGDGAGHVVQVGRTCGTARATGVPFDVAETHVWTVRGGLVARFEAYVDTAAMLAALAETAPVTEAARVTETVTEAVGA
jgi:hypothetical protein